MLTKTDKGEEMICQLDGSVFHIETNDLSIVLENNKMFYKSKRKEPYFEKIEQDFKENGLKYAVLHSTGLRNYIKAAIKNRINEQ